MNNKSTPLVSVIIASYNHALFIDEAVQSVLDQNYENIEVIIVDDGSTDDSWLKISAMTDSRIKKFLLKENVGACRAGNIALSHAKGEYICIISSDDRWKPNKIVEQLELFNARPGLGAVFGRAEFIDQEGNLLEVSASAPEGSIFDKQNRSRHEWLRYFFFNGNCICHPTVMIRRSIYDEIGTYDNRFRQLPDFRMWINLVKKHEFHIMDRALVEFRIHDSNGGNASRSSTSNNRRTWNEHYLLAQEFFDGLSLEDFYLAFSGDLCRPDIRSPEHMKCEQALLLAKPIPWFSYMYNPVGFSQLYALLGDPLASDILKKDFNFSDRSFHEYGAKMVTFYRDSEINRIPTSGLLREVYARAKAKGPMGMDRAVGRRLVRGE